MAPKLAKKRKATSASPARKKQKTSSSLRTGIETEPSSSDSPPHVPRAGVSPGAGPSADIDVTPARKKRKTSSSLRADIETAPSSSDSSPPVPRAGVSYGAGLSADIDVTPARKKQKTSSLRTGVETAPSLGDSPPPVPRAGVSYGAGPSADIESEGINVANGEESKVTGPKACLPCFFFIPDSSRVWARLKRCTKAHCKYSLCTRTKKKYSSIIQLSYDVAKT